MFNLQLTSAVASHPLKGAKDKGYPLECLPAIKHFMPCEKRFVISSQDVAYF